MAIESSRYTNFIVCSFSFRAYIIQVLYIANGHKAYDQPDDMSLNE